MAHYLDPKNDLTLINEQTKEAPKELLDNEYTREAVGYMERAAYTKEQLEVYDKWKIAAMTERSALKDARKEGRIEGKMERNIEIAVKAMEIGMPMEDISKLTGLSEQQIKEMIK